MGPEEDIPFGVAGLGTFHHDAWHGSAPGASQPTISSIVEGQIEDIDWLKDCRMRLSVVLHRINGGPGDVESENKEAPSPFGILPVWRMKQEEKTKLAHEIDELLCALERSL